MILAKELRSVGFKFNCQTCCFLNCKQRRNFGCGCDDYYPSNFKKVMGDVSEHINNNTVKSKDKRLRRRPLNDKNQMTCDCDTLDKYYVSMINDSLSLLRSGDIAYMFHLSQIKDLAKFVDVSFTYNTESESFAVTAKNGKKKRITRLE